MSERELVKRKHSAPSAPLLRNVRTLSSESSESSPAENMASPDHELPASMTGDAGTAGHDFERIGITSPKTGAAPREVAQSSGSGDGDDDASVLRKAATSAASPLPSAMRSEFEASLGHDLSLVRVHADADSNIAAERLGARAFTLGQQIHFGAGFFAPSTPHGQYLLAHEVTHTVQQPESPPLLDEQGVSVSASQMPIEEEARMAAGSMLGGPTRPVRLAAPSATGAILRDPLNSDLPSTIPKPPSGLPGFPTQAPTTNPFLPAPPAKPLGPDLWAPNADAYGVVYDVPAKDYRADAPANAPPMDAPMPSARIAPPGAIPGWKTVRPPLVVNGPNGEKITLDAGGDYVVVKHGQMMNSAWTYYTANFIPEVERTWNTAVPKIDSFTQTKKGDPELDAIAKEMGKKWNVPIQPKKGTVSAQVAGTGVDKGTSVSQVDKSVSDAGEGFKKGLQATGAKIEGDTAGTPVQQAVTALQGARDDVKAHMELCKNEAGILEGFASNFEAAGHKLKVRELEETKAKEETAKKEIENGQATLKRIDPELARTVGMFRDMAEKLKLVDMAKSAAGNVEKYGEVGLMYEAAKGMMTIAKWNALESAEKAIAITVDQIQSSLDKEALAGFRGAEKVLREQTNKLKTMASQAEAKFMTEKSLYEKLANVVRDKKNWKGEDPEQAELAAKALKAIPVVQKLTRFLLDVRGGLPKRLPDAAFNADRAYTLAVQGTPAPGASDLLTVAGWIAGITPVIDAEIVNWNAVLTRLEMVATDLGVV